MEEWTVVMPEELWAGFEPGVGADPTEDQPCIGGEGDGKGRTNSARMDLGGIWSEGTHALSRLAPLAGRLEGVDAITVSGGSGDRGGPNRV